MKKAIAVLTGCLLLGGVAMSASAASIKCTISAVKDNAVIMDCGDKTADLKVGTVVKVKTKKKVAVEGC